MRKLLPIFALVLMLAGLQPSNGRAQVAISSPDYGASVFAFGNPGTSGRDLGLAAGAGLGWVRLDIPWRSVEASCKNCYDWRDLEDISTRPRTPVEELLSGIIAQVLQVELLGRDDNFFDLGGHSLDVARVRALVHERLGVDLPLVEFFRATSIRALAELIEGRRPAARRRSTAPTGARLRETSDLLGQRRRAR